MTNDEGNPKPECRKSLGGAFAGFVLRILSFLRISSFVIRICEEWFMERILRTWRAKVWPFRGRHARLPCMTRHCWKCGWEWTLSGQPGRGESCPQCRSDLRVCLNCASYDVRAAQQCRDRRAEPVEEKHLGNFCEYFEFVRRAFAASDGENPRETS